MTRAIAWTRVSTFGQDKGERQLLQIRKYCKEKGYQLIEDETITEIVSGVAEVDAREGIEKVKKLSTDIADIVIVSDASRLTRKDDDDFMDLYNIVRDIQRTGLDLFILGSGQEYKANEKLTLIQVITLVIEADTNAKDRKRLLQKLRSGKDTVAEKGGFIGHKMPFGYRVNKKEDGYFEKVEEQAEIVRILFDLVGNQGYTVHKATEKLIRTHNSKWHPHTVWFILRNPTYKGEFHVLGHLINVPRIIEPEEFDAVQIKLSENHLFLNKGTKNFNPLKGIAKCACGESTLIVNGCRKGAKSYYQYRCVSKIQSYIKKQPCNNFGISADFLNNIVWNCTQAFINIDDFKVKTEQQRRQIQAEDRSVGKQILIVKAEYSDLDSRINTLMGSLSRAININVQTRLENELSELIAQQEKLTKRIDYLNKESLKLNNKLRDLADNLLPSFVSKITPEEKNEIFMKYIHNVTYYCVNLNKGFVVIKYKNGFESLVLASSKPSYKAYRVPQNDKFNPENRTILECLTPSQSEEAVLNHNFEILPDYYQEATYKQMFERNDMEEFLMDLTPPTTQADQPPA